MYQRKLKIGNIVYYKKYFYIYIFFFSLKLLSQPAHFCGMDHDHSLSNVKKSTLDVPSPDIAFQHYNGKYLPIRGSLRALAVFVQFGGDNTYDADWHLNEIPSYAEELAKMLKEYYLFFSNGEFNLDVDIYPRLIITDFTEAEYISWGGNYGHINKNVLERVDQEISFLPYDNWANTSNYNGYEGQDNQVDLIFMIYRTVSDRRFLAYWGISDLGFVGKFFVDNTKRYIHGGDARHQDASASGITICKGPGTGQVMDLMSAYRLIIHESLHKYMTESHIIYNFASLGVMSGSGGSFCMHSFERAFFGFIDYKVIDMPITDMTITIGDYVSTGEAYLIPVPGLPNDYYVLENHQQISPYDEAKGKGLYIFYLKYNGEQSQLDIQTADGKWNWVLDETNNVVKHSPNAMTGTSHLEVAIINNTTYYPPEMEGNQNDPFKMDGQKIYAPWTNPTSNGKHGIYQDYPTYLSIQLLDEINGELIVRITNDPRIVQVENTSSVNEFKLNQNYPNPFNSLTKISFSLNKGSNVLIKIFDALGCEVKTLLNEFKPIGTYVLDLDAGNMNSGVYFLRMQTENFVDTKKIILLK
jgi:hypothetical protein